MPEAPEEFGTVRELRRLAQVAHECDLQLFRDRDGSWLCTSATEARRVHYVTAISCDCRGFIAHQRCPHVALLLETLGWLTPIDAASDDGRAQRRPCPECSGAGSIYVRDCAKAGWPFPCCPACKGTGEILAGEPRPQSGQLKAAA